MRERENSERKEGKKMIDLDLSFHIKILRLDMLNKNNNQTDLTKENPCDRTM